MQVNRSLVAWSGNRRTRSRRWKAGKGQLQVRAGPWRAGTSEGPALTASNVTRRKRGGKQGKTYEGFPMDWSGGGATTTILNLVQSVLMSLKLHQRHTIIGL